ncbi:hypothetical protein ABE10_01705, partial [Bacillus toyonensis]|nr:hypothetical protein [Bacillus toyonensis]
MEAGLHPSQRLDRRPGRTGGADDPRGAGAMSDIRGEIARTLAEWTEDGPAEAWLVEVYEDAADALMPLIRRAQAEARGEILGRVAETAIELQHTREEVRERIRDGQSADW